MPITEEPTSKAEVSPTPQRKDAVRYGKRTMIMQGGPVW